MIAIVFSVAEIADRERYPRPLLGRGNRDD